MIICNIKINNEVEVINQRERILELIKDIDMLEGMKDESLVMELYVCVMEIICEGMYIY